jgi:diaminopimelate epimerase
MKNFSFVKMNGAGNDFIIIDADENKSFSPSNEIIKKICDRRRGIGADGVIILHPWLKSFKIDFFNADGYPGSLCGNGARCALKYAYNSGKISNKSTEFLFNNSLYSGEILGEDLVKINLNPPSKIKKEFKVTAAGKLINAFFADTGSPHLVINVKELKPGSSLKDFPVYEIGREIRYLPEFSPGGTNVNFVQQVQGKMFIRTYERGVEKETFACGTGSAASAIYFFLIENVSPPINLITYGGDTLIVNFDFYKDNIENLSLTGPALISYTGSFYS